MSFHHSYLTKVTLAWSVFVELTKSHRLTISSWPSLPVDSALSLSRLPPIIISAKEFNQPSFTAPTPYSLVVAEGIPPVSLKLVEIIRKLEYI